MFTDLLFHDQQIKCPTIEIGNICLALISHSYKVTAVLIKKCNHQDRNWNSELNERRTCAGVIGPGTNNFNRNRDDMITDLLTAYSVANKSTSPYELRTMLFL